MVLFKSNAEVFFLNYESIRKHKLFGTKFLHGQTGVDHSWNHQHWLLGSVNNIIIPIKMKKKTIYLPCMVCLH